MGPMYGPRLNFHLLAKTYVQKRAPGSLGPEPCSRPRQAREQVGFTQILKAGTFCPKPSVVSTDGQQSWLWFSTAMGKHFA